MKKFTIAITPGDPKGIGPEITRKALLKLSPQLKNARVVIFSKKFSVTRKVDVTFVEPPVLNSIDKTSVGWAIQSATKFVLEDPRTRVLVTGPISKSSLNREGFPYKGHTDFLAHLTQSEHVTMVLANDIFRVALTTAHCPLKMVSENITESKILKTIEQSAEFVRKNLKKKVPKIAVLGLNPHAGEGGLIGTEERSTIAPAMKKALEKSKKIGRPILLTGPHSADSFFAIEKKNKKKGKGHDIIIAHYHDQGLIPVKLADFNNGLNLTLGLPLIRTSVDHGTAFDIAGKNKADPSSMVYAIRKAIEYL